MKYIIGKIYLSLPAVVQNILVSVYGAKLYIERYGVGRKRAELTLKETEKYSIPEMRSFQEKKFVEIARYAIKHVPFYIDWSRSNLITSEEINTIEDLSKFPVIDKDLLRQSPERFISNENNIKKLLPLSTSGSTGRPLKIYTDNRTRTSHYAFFTRLRGWFDVGKRGGRATFFGRVVVPQNQSKPPFWRYDWAQNNLLMSTYHLSSKNIEHYIEKLASFKPKEIIGHPSSIYKLAKYINENGVFGVISPNVIITTAETLMPYQRTCIENAFDCPLVDQYGCTEMAFFASQCQAGKMHFHPEHAIVEIVDEKNCSVEPGVHGELVATSLITKVMPLIRYKVGDSLAISKEPADCHPAFPVIAFLEGRTDDLIYTRSGNSVGRLSPIFRSDKNITVSQLIQEENGDIKVYVVPNDKYSSKNREMIRQELIDRVGDGFEISISEVESIPKEKNGKFRPVKSYYKRTVS